MPAGMTLDHTIRPVFIDSATNRPLPGLWSACPFVESSPTYISPCASPSAGEAAASVPTLVSHSLWPVRLSSAFAEPSSSIRYSVFWKMTGGNSSSA